MDMENKEERIQPLSEEEMEQAVGGVKGKTLECGEFLRCKACGMQYSGYAGDEIPFYKGRFGCSRCGGDLEYDDRRPSSRFRFRPW